MQLREQCCGPLASRSGLKAVSTHYSLHCRVTPTVKGDMHYRLRPTTAFEMIYKNVTRWSLVLEETLKLGSLPSGLSHQQSGHESLLSTVQWGGRHASDRVCALDFKSPLFISEFTFHIYILVVILSTQDDTTLFILANITRF